jgi:porin
MHKILTLTGGALASCLLLSNLQAEHTRFWSSFEPHDVPALGTKDWWEDPYLTGRWWGVRDNLFDDGIDFSLTYTNNLAGNPVGGLSQGFTYTDNIYFGVELMMDRLVGWEGASIFVSALDRNGTSLSQKYIGNQFTVQQIFGNQTIVFYALLLEQEIIKDRLKVRLGRFSTGDDFASSPIYWLYMNNGIDGNPQALPVNTGFSSYPNAVWGSSLIVTPSDEWTAKAGVFQVNPRLGKMAYHGLDFSIRPDDGILLIGQFQWSPEFFQRDVPTSAATSGQGGPSDAKSQSNTMGKKTFAPLTERKGLPGNYWVGAYYSSANYAQFGTEATAQNSYGFYWHADQMVYQESPGSDQGLTIWTAMVYSPQANISKLPFQANAGLFYKGLVPTRDDDISLFGLVYGQFSSNYANSVQGEARSYPGYEMVLEWGYRAQVTRFLYVQPDVQWVIRPGGQTGIPNALVLGAQIGVVF